VAKDEYISVKHPSRWVTEATLPSSSEADLAANRHPDVGMGGGRDGKKRERRGDEQSEGRSEGGRGGIHETVSI